MRVAKRVPSATTLIKGSPMSQHIPPIGGEQGVRGLEMCWLQ